MPIPRDEETVSGSQDEMLSATSHGEALRTAVEEEMNLLMDGEYQQEPMHETVGMFQNRVQDRVRDYVRNQPMRYPPLQPPPTAEQYVIAPPIPSVVGSAGGESNIHVGRVIDQGISYATPFIQGAPFLQGEMAGTGNMRTIQEFPRH